MTSIFWACAVVTAMSAFLSMGFSFLGLRSTGDTLVASMYTLSRSIALAVVSLVPLFSGSRSWLIAVALAMVIVQALDVYVGIKQQDLKKIFGPASLSVLNVILLGLLIVQ